MFSEWLKEIAEEDNERNRAAARAMDMSLEDYLSSKERRARENDRLRFLEERRAEVQYEIYLMEALYFPDRRIKPTKANLNKIIQWSTSRYNEYRKGEVIDIILANIANQGKGPIRREFSAGGYTPSSAMTRSGSYLLVVDYEASYLVVNFQDDGQIVYMFDEEGESL